MKQLFIIFFLFSLTFSLQAQYGSLDAILTRLEERKGINQNLENVNINDKKFILIKDFGDHTERSFIVFKGNLITYVEVFDDKVSDTSTSNVFSGDMKRSRRNIFSIRADRLEGKKIPIPVTKTLLLTRQDKILYLIDLNSRERWIDEISINEAIK